MGNRKYLGEFEQMVLLAILQRGRDANGYEVRQELEDVAERTVSKGAFYTTLDRLASKGLLASEMGDADAGKSHRRYYSVTEQGIEALRDTAAAVRSMWSGLE